MAEPHNTHVLTLLFRAAEWHGFAKLRMQTDSSLAHLEKLTKEFGFLMRQFRNLTCPDFRTYELPREATARNRRKQKQRQTELPVPELSGKRLKIFNLNTYKYHALGDYVEAIKNFGGTDSFSTQIV
jgi:hypothetical protein